MKETTEETQPEIELCQQCKTNPAQDDHTCPYAQELYQDETECNCCSKCEGECCMSI